MQLDPSDPGRLNPCRAIKNKAALTQEISKEHAVKRLDREKEAP